MVRAKRTVTIHQAELERIVANKPLSDDVFEIVSRALD